MALATIYHMPKPTKTTVYLPGDDYDRLKQLARHQGRTAAMLVREAVALYIAAPTGVAARPASMGLGHSGRSDISEKTETLLTGMGRRR